MESGGRGNGRLTKLRSHRDLDVYRKAFAAAMTVFRYSRTFPKAETFSLTDQIRRSSRSVNANISEAWRKRWYEAAFISKLSDAETEAGETQTWLEFAVACGYLDREQGADLNETYEKIIGMLVTMINNPTNWTIGER
jgi:four helix bundle protein